MAADEIEEVVARLLQSVGARAAGLWRAEGDCLVQKAFVGCAELPSDVARQFAAATRSVPLTEVSLGIVAAATTGQTVVSRVSEQPADAGSGRWLRAFGAERSVAVPLHDNRGNVCAVLSVALAAGAPGDLVVDDRLREVGLGVLTPLL
jgi:hypothetical protein